MGDGMTTPDPLTILTRAIDAWHGAPVARQDVLWTRLMRLTAPVLEERESLLTFLERGYQWIDQHPDVPDREKRETTWIAKLQRYQQIEDVLATFPASPISSTAEPQTTRSATERTQPLPMPLARPP